MQPDQFLQKNYEYFQEWHHWRDKALSLRAQARALYGKALPDIRKYEKARKAALRELKKRPVAPIKAKEPDIRAAVAL
jgi:type II secretory pathway component PulL